MTTSRQKDRARAYRHQRLKIYFTATLIGLLPASSYLHAGAAEADQIEPLALRTIMQDMGKNMQTIADGISREDWELVAKSAVLIADHPQPPFVEKVRILGFIGSDVPAFKRHDEKTHELAKALQQAAMEDEGQMVIASFAKLQKSCLACHEQYRKPFVEHFYTR